MRIAVTLLGVLLAVTNVAPASAQTLPGPFAQLQRELAISAHHAPGRVALEVQDLSTGYHSGLNASEEMPAASTIKIPVMVEVFHQMEAGKFDLNRRHSSLANVGWNQDGLLYTYDAYKQRFRRP